MTNLPKLQNFIGYDRLKSFQLGGSAPSVQQAEDKDPGELIYVLHHLMKNTGEEPTGGTPEDIIAYIENNKPESDSLGSEYRTKISTQQGIDELKKDADFVALYNKLMSNEDIAYAAKGAKLQKLKAQSGMSIPKRESALAKKEPTGQDALKAAAKLNAAKKAVVPTKKVVENVRVPNKGRDIEQIGGNTHNEQVTVTKKVLNKAEGGKVEPTKSGKPKLVKKGGKTKCSCGCEMIKSKAAGGKVIETCACKCGGKMKKKK